MDAISIYGNIETPEEAEQRRKDFEAGITRYHETTYLEFEIPQALENELSDFIEKRIKQFEQDCQCEDCKENKNTNE